MAQKEEIQAIRDLVFTLYRRFGSLQREQICCDWVTVPQCYTLQLLQKEGELTAGELSERLGIDASTVTRAADVLEKRGVIERRRPEKGDRRRVLLRLTSEGSKLTDRLNSQANETFARLLEGLEPDERGDLVRSLGSLTRLIDGLGEKCGGDGC